MREARVPWSSSRSLALSRVDRWPIVRGQTAFDLKMVLECAFGFMRMAFHHVQLPLSEHRTWSLGQSVVSFARNETGHFQVGDQ